MATSRDEGDVVHMGAHTFQGTTTLPNSTITSDMLNEQKYVFKHAQPNTAATTETRTLAVILGTTGTAVTFKAGSIAKAVGDSTVTVDLKKNGSSILSAVITLDNANTNRVLEAGTISSTSLAVGDWLETVITATVGTGTLPTGVFVQLELKQKQA